MKNPQIVKDSADFSLTFVFFSNKIAGMLHRLFIFITTTTTPLGV